MVANAKMHSREPWLLAVAVTRSMLLVGFAAAVTLVPTGSAALTRAVAAGGPPRQSVSWADSRHGWAENHGNWPCPTGRPAQVHDGRVCSTENGGKTWRQIFYGGSYIFGDLRASVRAGIVSTGAHGHVEFWTRDNGRHWYPTSVVGGSNAYSPFFTGLGSRLYWAEGSGETVYQVEGWPPTAAVTCTGEWVASLSGEVNGRHNICLGPPVDAGMRSVAVVAIDAAHLHALTLLPAGFAAVYERERDGGLTVAVHDGDTNIANELPKPNLPPGSRALYPALSVSWPRLTLRILWTDNASSLEEVDQSTDGGRTFAATIEPGWQRGPALPVARAGTAAITRGSEIVLVGGRLAARGATQASRRVDALEPQTGTSRLLPRLPVALSYAAAASAHGRIYVVGGFDRRRRPERRAFVLEGRRWRTLPRPPAARAAGGAALLGGKLYVVGGVAGSGLARDMLVFDPRRSRWSASRGPRPRAYLTVAAVRDRLVVVGGRAGGLGTATRRAEVYDPGRRHWRALPPAPEALSESAASAIGNVVVTVGGVRDSYLLPAGSVYAFNLESRTWSRLPDLVDPRYSLAAAAVGGRLYALGGGRVGARQTGISEFLEGRGEPVTTRFSVGK
jgi:Kelch motif